MDTLSAAQSSCAKYEIILNDASVSGFEATATIAQVLEQLRAGLPDGEVLMEIMVDERQRALDDDDMAAISETTLDTIGSLVVRSQPLAVIADEAMGNLTPIVTLCLAEFEASARAFRLGRVVDAFASFARGADLLQDLHHFLVLFGNYRSLDEGHPAWGSYAQHEVALVGALTSLEKAQEVQDWNLVADLVQFEIMPLCGALGELGVEMTDEAQAV